MNIFVLDKNPKLAAQYHNDKHVVKMILESCQLLVTPYYTNNNIVNRQDAKEFRSTLTEMFPSFPRDQFYGFGYYSHPCARWVQYSFDNWVWLLELGKSLSKEYTKRYDKVHACDEVLNWFEDNPPIFDNLTSDRWYMNSISVPANATSIKDDVNFDSWNHAVNVYREYYRTDKIKLAQWKTSKPIWFTTYEDVISAI